MVHAQKEDRQEMPSKLTEALTGVSDLWLRVYLGRALSGGFASTTSILAPSSVVPEHINHYNNINNYGRPPAS